jgi:hypothetical protein
MQQQKHPGGQTGALPETSSRLTPPNDSRLARLSGNRCLCCQCGEYFTTVRNFDRHQRLDRQTGDTICLDPAAVGLVLTAYGYWQLPPSAMPFAGAAERTERGESAAMGADALQDDRARNFTSAGVVVFETGRRPA